MMANWLMPALLATMLWGIVGILQKLGCTRINAASLLVWVTVGYVLSLPCFWAGADLGSLSAGALLLGVAAGTVNGLGAWSLFAAFEQGAKASVAIPLTALYPLITLGLAFLFLSERLTGWEWVGVLLALSGGAMLSYEKEQKVPAK
jgi:transporter family protein